MAPALAERRPTRPSGLPPALVAALPPALVAVTVVLVCVPASDQSRMSGAAVSAADISSAALAVVAGLSLAAGHRLPRAAARWPLAAVVVSLGLATLASPDAAGSGVGLVRYLQVFVAVPLAVALALRGRRDVWLVCAALLATGAFEGAVGTWQHLTATGASFAGEDVRAVGTFGALEVMGMATVVGYGIVVAVGLALRLPGRARAGLLLLAALLAIPLLLSLSRGAVLACAAAVALMLVVVSPRLAATVAVFTTAAAVALLGGLGSGGLGSGGLGTAGTAGSVTGGSGTAGFGTGMSAPDTGEAGIVARLATIGSATTAPDRSIQDRYDLWQTALHMWRGDPVTGVGLRQFPAFRDAHAPLSLSSGSDVADASLGFRREPLLSPHNMYLLVLSEQGMVGALSFGGLLAALAVGTLRGAAQTCRAPARPLDRPPDRQAGFAGVACAGIVAFTAVSFVYGDIGGSTTVLTSVLLGLALWWSAQRPGRPAAQTGTAHAGTVQAGTAHAGTAHAGTAHAGRAQAGRARAGRARAGTAAG